MELRRGDLVLGLKPWNSLTHHGIVVDKRRAKNADTGLFVDSFKVFWISRVPAEKKQYMTWEVESSVQKWQG